MTIAPDRLMTAIVTLFAVAVVAGVITYALQAVVQARRRQRTTAVLLHLAHTALGGGPAPVPGALRRLRPSVRGALLADLGGHLSGRDLVTLSGLAERSGVLALSHRWCQSRRWRRRLRGAQFRTVLVADDPLTHDLLVDAQPLVRIEAARAAGRHPDRRLCDALVSMLGDGSAGCRNAALEALMRSGSTAADAVAGGLAAAVRMTAPPAARTEALLVAAAFLHDPRFVAAAGSLRTHPAASVRSAALAVLGSSGHAVNAAHAASMSTDPDAGVRTAAARALGKLAPPLDAHLLVPGLSDPEWEVREASAWALVALGPVGRTYLRRVARRHDGPGAEMAQRVLDIPDDAPVRATASPDVVAA